MALPTTASHLASLFSSLPILGGSTGQIEHETHPLPLRLHVQPSRDDPQPLVLYHGKSCPDGFAAAPNGVVVLRGSRSECIGLDHGQVQSLADLPSVAGRCVYILDFSLPAEVLRAMDECAQQLVLLDHRQSAADKLAGFACRCGVVHFDMNLSGAHLAWEFFFPDQDVPALVAMVEDRDLWLWHLPDSAGFLAALDMEVRDFALGRRRPLGRRGCKPTSRVVGRWMRSFKPWRVRWLPEPLHRL